MKMIVIDMQARSMTVLHAGCYKCRHLPFLARLLDPRRSRHCDQQVTRCVEFVADLGIEKVPALLDGKRRNVPGVCTHQLGPGKCLLFTQLFGVNRLFAGARVREHLHTA